LDLFDYNDFHWAKDERFKDLLNSVVSGRYKPSPSIPTRLEKKHGVCRTVVTPSPEDSIILQCIVESLLKAALDKQPSKNAFFSRSHQAPDAAFQFGKDYIWFRQWRRFSKKRFKIASVHEWVATTDIATFFDNVQYVNLRNIISTFDGIEEVILDILFCVLDALCWRPDYLPSAQVGLPQVQFDAPRLLAHVYLYEIDAYLKTATDDAFVRWVDDITFAVDTRDECKVVLRDLDSLLQMRGVRLNSGKTHVLSAAAARRFFHQRANDNLDRWKSEVEKIQKSKGSFAKVSRKIKRSFLNFTSIERGGHSDKIIKRYIGLAASMREDWALPYCFEKFPTDPGLRDQFYWYFEALGPSDQVLGRMREYLFSGSALDDASQCQIAKVLTNWEVDPATPLFASLQALARDMGTPHYVGQDTFRFVAALWMLTKYSTQAPITAFIENSSSVWEHSEFLSRQVAAASGKFRDRKVINWFESKIKKHSLRLALSVFGAIEGLRSINGPVPKNIRMYILNGGNKTTYTLQRFLVAFSVLSSPTLPQNVKANLKSQLMTVLVDPHYKVVIQRI